MIQSERFNIIDLMNPLRVVSKAVNKSDDLSNKLSLNDVKNNRYFKLFGTRITLTSNKIKDIMKAVKSFENSVVLLKATTRKIISQEGGFLNFSEPINDSWFTINEKCTSALAKIVLLLYGSTAAMSATNVAIQNKI